VGVKIRKVASEKDELTTGDIRGTILGLKKKGLGKGSISAGNWDNTGTIPKWGDGRVVNNESPSRGPELHRRSLERQGVRGGATFVY